MRTSYVPFSPSRANGHEDRPLVHQGLHPLDEPHRADRRPLRAARLPQHQDIPQGEAAGGQGPNSIEKNIRLKIRLKIFPRIFPRILSKICS